MEKKIEELYSMLQGKKERKKEPAKNKMFNNFEIFPLLPSFYRCYHFCMHDTHTHFYGIFEKNLYDESLKGDIERCQNLSSISFSSYISFIQFNGRIANAISICQSLCCQCVLTVIDFNFMHMNLCVCIDIPISLVVCVCYVYIIRCHPFERYTNVEKLMAYYVRGTTQLSKCL